MQFTRRLHDGIRSGQITCSVRIWQQPRVKLGGRYRLGDGHIEVTQLRQVNLDAITPALARRSGFADLDDLLKTARHGRGDCVFIVDFVYRPGPAR